MRMFKQLEMTRIHWTQALFWLVLAICLATPSNQAQLAQPEVATAGPSTSNQVLSTQPPESPILNSVKSTTEQASSTRNKVSAPTTLATTDESSSPTRATIMTTMTPTTTTTTEESVEDQSGLSGRVESRSISHESRENNEYSAVATTEAPLTNSSDGSNENYNAKLVLVESKETEEPETSVSPKLESGDGETESKSDNGEHQKKEAKQAQNSLNPPTKLINMTHIEEIYTKGHKNADEIIESWHKLSGRLKGLVGKAIGSIVPLALNMTQEAKISSNCTGAMLKWVLNLNQLKSWALRMLDASGKPIAGLLEGSLTLFGNYRECLKIRAPDDDEMAFTGKFQEHFRGKYCIIQAKPWLPEKESPYYNLNTQIKGLVAPKGYDDGTAIGDSEAGVESSDDSTAGASDSATYDQNIFDELSVWMMAFNFINIRYDLCIPSTCSRMDIQKIMSYLLKDITEIKARVLRCEMDPADNAFGGAVVESSSEHFDDALNVEPTEGSASAALGSSQDAQDVYFSRVWSRLGWLLMPMFAIVLVILATTWSIAHDRGMIKKRRSKFSKTLTSLSLKRSVSNHFCVDYDQLADDKPLALYGLRFIFVFWVILVESAVNINFEYLRELMMLKDLIFWWPLQVVINSTLQFDSIILLTAFTMAYKTSLNTCTNNFKSFIKYVLDKYIRLMPSVMIMVALVIVMPMTYRGPVWNDYVLRQSNVCRSTGWLNTAFIQNYLPYNQVCLPQTWLLSVEFQLVFLMAPILYYLNKNYIKNMHETQERDQSRRINNFKTSLAQSKLKGDIFHQDALSKCLDAPSQALATKSFFWIRTLPGLLLIACILFGLASSFYNVFTNGLPPTWFYTMADPESKALYFSNHMMKLWPHVAVFALGIIAGLECRRRARNIASKNTINQQYPYKNRNLAYESNTNLNSTSSASNVYNNDELRGHQNNLLSASLPVISSDNYGSSANINMLDELNGNNGINSDRQKYLTNLNTNVQPLNGILRNSGSNTSMNNINNSYDNIYNNAGLTSKSVGDLFNDLEANDDDDDVNLQTNRKRSGLPRFLRKVIGCLLAITTMSIIIFVPHEWSSKDLPAPLIAGLYDIGSRFSWSLSLIWILYMVSVPNEDRKFGTLAKSLGHPIMVFLGKLSFLIYIIHPFVHTAVLAIQEQPIYSSWLMLFHILIGNITITVILASLVSLFVEMPCRNLFRRCGTSLLLTPPPGAAGGHNNNHNHNNNINNSSSSSCGGHSNPAIGISSSSSSAHQNSGASTNNSSISQATTTTS